MSRHAAHPTRRTVFRESLTRLLLAAEHLEVRLDGERHRWTATHPTATEEEA